MKFSIITPSYNNGDNILESIQSVYNQTGNFTIEHIVIDGGSTDSTLDILQRFNQEYGSKKKGYVFKYISEPDNGMYDAILKGFSMSTGDIMAWINTDDYYLPDAFQVIANAFKSDRVYWLTGISNTEKVDGTIIQWRLREYRRSLITKGAYGTSLSFIRQESVFWRRTLWDRVNYNILGEYKYAGDFRLWQIFSEQEELFSLDYHVATFRKRENQKSSNWDGYLQEVNKSINLTHIEKIVLKLIRKIETLFKVYLIRGKRING